ncbi:MAG: DUF2796 domain-containing protein [Rubrivivax sp.]
MPASTDCRLLARAALCVALVAPLAALAQGHAHVHGVATLDIAVEPRRIVVQFATPLDNLVGFERAPRTDAERQRADEAVARLKAGDQMLRFDPAAQCKLAKVALNSAALELGTPDAAPAKGEHAELEASYEFACADAGKAGYVDVGLFGFKQLQRVQIQLALPGNQFKRELKRPAQRIVLTK